MCGDGSNCRSISLGFTEERVPEGQHICYLFNDSFERRRVMAKYIESGLLENEKVLYLADDLTGEEMLDSLEELGVEVRSRLEQLTVAQAASTYCPGGVFVGEKMLEATRDFYRQAVGREGYRGARGTGEMSWCLVEGRADESAILEYEAHLNELVADHPYTACCQYDVRRFDGRMILDVLAIHPYSIVRGQLVKNPYYIGPQAFLQEYRSRAKGSAAR
jgi:hypothetical protein